MRLIDADNVDITEESFGIDDFIGNMIAECSEEMQIEWYDELRMLCKRMVMGFTNVINTEPTAYDVEKVVEQLGNEPAWCDGETYYLDKNKVLEIVRGGGIDE